MNRFEYPVLLAPAKEGGFVVTCRDLPEVITQGENVTDALAEAGQRHGQSIRRTDAGG